MKTHLIDKFYSLANVGEEDQCWLWGGAVDKHGYGTMRIGPKNWFAHRLSLLLHHGELDSNLNVNHKCDNPLCVNPSHLYQGTQQENIADAKVRGRMDRTKKLKGEEHPAAKLSAAEVELIRSLYEPRVVTQAMLASLFNVTKSTIQKIILGVLWKSNVATS